MRTLENRKRVLRIFGLAGMAAAIAVGAWARFAGLGFSSLTADEYYFVASIRRIIETGVPGFESGGYYVRGLLLQYLTVPAIWLAGSEELGVRVPSALFGLAAAFAAYLYGRRTIGRPWALALAAMLLLSSWEVEFSRFGRMYAGFQFMTLALLVTLHDTIGGTRGWRVFLPPLAGLGAVGTHALAVFLLPLLYLPVLLPGAVERLGGRRRVAAYVLAATLPLAIGFAHQLIDFRGLGVVDQMPAGYEGTGRPAMTFSAFPFWSLGDATVNVAAVGALVALVFGAGAWLVRRGRAEEPTLTAAICLVFAAAHMLLPAFVLGLVLALRHGLPRSMKRHRTAAKLTFGAAGAAFAWIGYAGWLTYGAGSREWIAESGVNLFSEAARRVFLWPDPGPAVFEAWTAEFPVLFWLFAGALLVQVLTRLRDPWTDLVRNPAFVVTFLVLMLGLGAPRFVVTRYSYFVYPVALALLTLSVRDVARLAAPRISLAGSAAVLGIPVALVLFAVGGDFHPRHLASVATYASTYRTSGFEPHAITWYERNDHRATAEYLSSHAAASDPVITVELPALSNYLERDHVLYLDRRGTRFPNVSRRRGTLDLWSNRRLLSTLPELRDYTVCPDGPVWIVANNIERRRFAPAEVWGETLVEAAVVFMNADASQEVTRVTLDDSGCPGAGPRG